MKKATLIVLAILVMATYGGAQVTGPWANDGISGTSGSHLAHGCLLCHAPHTNGAAPYTGYSATAAATTNPTFGPDWAANGQTPPAKIPGVLINAPTNNASIYLWAAALSPQTYTTWDGHPVNSTGVTKASAVVHTLLCMSCHDNATGSHEMGAYNLPGSNLGLSNNATSNVNGEAIGESRYNCNWNGTACAPGWSTSATLQNSHPVDVAYTSGGKYWLIDSNGAFTDASGASGFTYGHPAKLWMQGTTAYVECTTCHDPHREYNTAVWNGTKYVISSTANTIYYVRGPFADPTAATTNGSANADFCRSCHFDKTQVFATTGKQY